MAKDASKVQTVDGTVHPLCAQTLSYLRRLFSYPDVETVGGAIRSKARTEGEVRNRKGWVNGFADCLSLSLIEGVMNAIEAMFDKLGAHAAEVQ